MTRILKTPRVWLMAAVMYVIPAATRADVLYLETWTGASMFGGESLSGQFLWDPTTQSITENSTGLGYVGNEGVLCGDITYGCDMTYQPPGSGNAGHPSFSGVQLPVGYNYSFVAVLDSIPAAGVDNLTNASRWIDSSDRNNVVIYPGAEGALVGVEYTPPAPSPGPIPGAGLLSLAFLVMAGVWTKARG